MNRRDFFIGAAAVAVLPLIPRIAPTFDERELLRPFDPEVRGIRWQSWPWGLPRPDEFASGSMDTLPHGTRKPLSHFMAKLERYRTIYPDLDFEPII